MILYITKNALTKGIETKEGARINDKVASVNHSNNNSQLFFKPDWHVTRDEAIQQANRMKKIKIENLNKQINRIESLKFI